MTLSEGSCQLSQGGVKNPMRTPASSQTFIFIFIFLRGNYHRQFWTWTWKTGVNIFPAEYILRVNIFQRWFFYRGEYSLGVNIFWGKYFTAKIFHPNFSTSKFSIFIGPMCTWGPIIGSPCHYDTFLKPCEDLVKTVNVVNVVKI